MLGWAFLFIYNNTMKFVQTLLESYFRLNEAEADVIGEIAAAGNGLGNGDGSRKPITPPNGGNTGQVGLNDDGEAFLEGGPLAGFTKVNVGQEVSTENLKLLQNWWAGEEGAVDSTATTVQDPRYADAKLNPDEVDRLKELEGRFPGITDVLFSVYDSISGVGTHSSTSDKREGLLQQKSKTLDKNGKPVFRDLLLGSIKSRIFGGKGVKSLAYLIGMDSGGVLDAFRENLDAEEVEHLSRDANQDEILNSLNVMARLSEHFRKALEEDCKFFDNHPDQAKEAQRSLIRSVPTKDRKGQTTRPAASYFFRNSLSNGIGVSLALGQGNPLNIMAEAYNDLVNKCKKEDYSIQEMDIESEEAPLVGDLEDKNAGEVSQMTKKVSEGSIPAFFSIWQAATLTGLSSDDQRTLVQAGISKIRKIIKGTAEDVYQVVQMQREIYDGAHPMTQEHQRIINMVMPILEEEDLDGDGKVDNDPKGRQYTGQERDMERVLNAVSGWGKEYFIRHIEWFNAVEPDFVVEVGDEGGGSKGVKSDSYFIKRTAPNPKTLPKKSVVNEVDFSSLSITAQKAIQAKSNTPIAGNTKFWLIGDSLKVYGKEGNFKAGESSSIATEISRLLGESKKGSKKKHDDAHGAKSWELLRPPKIADKEWEKRMRGGKKILRNVRAVHNALDNLLEAKKTNNMSDKQYIVFLKKQFDLIFSNLPDSHGNKAALEAQVAGATTPAELRDSELIANIIKDGTDDTGIAIDTNIQKMKAKLKAHLTAYLLNRDIVYNDDGTPNKKAAGTMHSYTAIGALMMSMGADTTDLDVQSTVHIKKTGNLYRGTQNKYLQSDIHELLDPNNERGLQISKQQYTYTVRGFGPKLNLNPNDDGGSVGAYTYLDTRGMTPVKF